jgi:hypothetical protein
MVFEPVIARKQAESYSRANQIGIFLHSRRYRDSSTAYFNASDQLEIISSVLSILLTPKKSRIQYNLFSLSLSPSLTVLKAGV